MKINGEQLIKIIEEEAVNVLKEVWMPGNTIDSIAGTYANLPSKEKKQSTTQSTKSQQPQQTTLKSISGTKLQKQIKILMAQTNPIFLMEIKLLLDKLAPQKFLSNIVKNAKIDPSYFEKDLENFIDKLEQYSSIALKENTKQDIQQKRKLIANIDKVMSRVRDKIFLKLSQDIEKNIDSIRQNIIEYISKNKKNIGDNNKQIAQMLLSSGGNKWLLDNLKQDIMAVSNSLVLITKQTILNAYSQKEIPE
jgi:hypothetical protein